MWPKRKIQLVASPAAPGIAGVRAVLEGIHWDFSEVDPTAEKLNKGFTESWWEKPFDCSSASFNDLDPTTDVVYWPGEVEGDYWRKKALAEGFNLHSIQSFIHNILDDDLILSVVEPLVFIAGRPLVEHILNEAGFEPTILWPTVEGKWQCERRQGLHWLIPESWLKLLEQNILNMGNVRSEERTTWVVRESGVDFYREQEGPKFVGRMPRWSEPTEEQAACQNIAMCLNLGVSWLDIRLALSSVWNSLLMTDNLRWNNNDFGWNDGASGETLSAEPFEHVEDWWAR